MGRVWWDGEGGEDYPNQLLLMERSALNAIRGKRGQAIIRDLLDALRALPQPSLEHGSVITEEAGEWRVCAIGALAAHRLALQAPERDLESVLGELAALVTKIRLTEADTFEGNYGETEIDEVDVTARLADQIGVPRILAYRIAGTQDGWGESSGLPPIERWRAMVKWCERNLQGAASPGY